MALKRHDAKVHMGHPLTYQCHCCNKTYLRGYLLSKHLIADHDFRLPPGHSRFIYKKDIDDFYRLQTKRVEKLKPGQQVSIQPVEEDPNVNVTFEVEEEIGDVDSPVNLKFKKILKPKTPTVQHLFTEESNQDSKDINDFAIVKTYKNYKREKLEDHK
jgi:hypothetical protein